MAWDTAIHLLTFTKTVNDIGDQVKTPVPRKVFATKKSIRQSEFYQAQGTDLKPEIMFEIWLADYQDEHFLTYEKRPGDGQQQYTILRTFEPNNDRIELVCGRVINKDAP